MIIVSDIGGTRMRFAWCDPKLGTIGEPVIEETPKNYKEGIERVKQIIDQLKSANGNEKLEGIVVGLPGVVNSAEGMFISSPNLSSWAGNPIGDELSEIANVPVFLCNDASLGALGEAHFGAGKGYEIVAYFTVSTGIGGAKVVRGRLSSGKYNSEPGFQILDTVSGATFEQLASGGSLSKKYNSHPKDIAKTKIWAEVEKILAEGLCNAILFWSPDVVVVGGSMSNDLDAGRLKKLVQNNLKVHPTTPDFAIAGLGSIGGLYGAMVFWRQKM